MQKNGFKITIIGGGNGGQAMAGHFGMLGHEITLYNRTLERIKPIEQQGGVLLKEAVSGFGRVTHTTNDLKAAVKGAEIIMITTTADAHRELAVNMAPYLEDNQLVVLNPGRTGGAIEFRNILNQYNVQKKIYLAEAQSLIYACRIDAPAEVRIVGVKDKVLLAALPAADTEYVVEKLNSILNCFVRVANVLVTSFENIGAIFHPAVVLFNAAAIERGEKFYFYNDMTPSIAAFLEKIDAERLKIGKAFGIDLIPISEWISYAYSQIKGEDLCSKMRNNPAYFKILAPTKLNSRLLLEDIPTGILPLLELGKLAGINAPLMQSVFDITSVLLGIDFRLSGRTLENLRLKGKSVENIIAELS